VLTGRGNFPHLQTNVNAEGAPGSLFEIDQGADIFALSEGDAPFATARLGGHDHVSDFLAPLMKQAQSLDPKIWVRARIAQLRRKIAYLEEKLAR
jgi:hypothetical protein